MYNLILWLIGSIQLFSLAFFLIDLLIYALSQISKFINLIDFSSLAYVAGKSSIYISIAICFILIIVISMEFIITALYRNIVTSHPWIISMMQTITDIYLRLLFIPSLNMMISTFDCIVVHEIAPDESRVDGIFQLGLINIRFLSGNAIEIVSAILSIFFLLVTFFYRATIQLFIFNHNEKNGALFGCSSGWFRGLRTFLLFGIVFCMRELIDFPFNRRIVSVGTSGFITVIVLLKQQFYKFTSNYLTILPYSLFGAIRLCAEIGYQFEEALNSIIPQIICMILGFMFGDVLSIFLNSVLKRQVRKKWFLTSELRRQVDIEKEQMKKNTAQKFGTSIDLDPFFGQNRNQTIPSPLFGQQGNRPTTQSQASSFKNQSGLPQVSYQLVSQLENRRSPRPSNCSFPQIPSVQQQVASITSPKISKQQTPLHQGQISAEDKGFVCCRNT
ncbi:MAG: hypothetical protein EZS28_010746 [Streblomastix strix]|uniref:Transmembrane protein n=1 Tax=Streblomastix strix TaxID=222440 RepID=A0A5J4WGF3_9EUKA|nr:MAG: hypothetical protein EZS28_010746 [Streblomastix strix]